MYELSKIEDSKELLSHFSSEFLQSINMERIGFTEYGLSIWLKPPSTILKKYTVIKFEPSQMIKDGFHYDVSFLKVSYKTRKITRTPIYIFTLDLALQFIKGNFSK